MGVSVGPIAQHRNKSKDFQKAKRVVLSDAKTVQV